MQQTVQPPAAPSLSQSAGGALGATTYFVKLTYVTAQGETIPGPEANFAASANNVLVVQSPAAVTSPQGNVVTGYNVYVSNTAGGGSGAETKQAGPIAIGTAWTEPTSGLVGGAAMPTINNAVVPGALQPMGQPYPTKPLQGGNTNPGMQSNSGTGR
jgi:hypothetical protein